MSSFLVNIPCTHCSNVEQNPSQVFQFDNLMREKVGIIVHYHPKDKFIDLGWVRQKLCGSQPLSIITTFVGD